VWGLSRRKLSHSGFEDMQLSGELYLHDEIFYSNSDKVHFLTFVVIDVIAEKIWFYIFAEKSVTTSVKFFSFV